MIKKSIVAILGVALVAVFASCAAKYADLNEVMTKMIASTDTLVADMDKAVDGKAVAAALMTYTEALKSQQGKFQELMGKYPELKTATEPPKELKDSYDKLNAMAEKMLAVQVKFQTYAEDPDVMGALLKLTELQM